MLVHLRLNVPDDLSASIEDMLVTDDRITNVTKVAGASLKPHGDVFEADVAKEAASFILDDLESSGLEKCGGIVLSEPLDAPFHAAEEVEKAAEGDPDDAVIWRVVERRAVSASKPTLSYLAFLVIATALASIAVITDSAVLVVGAMVVGPEFATVAAICTGLVLRKWRLAGRSLWFLIWGFAFAIAVITAISFIGLHTGFMTHEQVTKPRPQTGFIWRPDKWSFIVALWAGAAGVLALLTDKGNAMVGVFISVTTVPAAGNLALGIAIGSMNEISGSAQQLGVNILGMVIAGVLTLGAERLLWRRLGIEQRRRIAHGTP